MDPSSSQTNFAVLPQQSSRSCTECSRRKLKCSRTIPCTACVKRGQAFACVAPDKKKSSNDPDPKTLLDERRAAALSEVQLFRSSLASLQSRLPNLEAFIAASGGDTSSSTSTGTHQHSNDNMNAILRNFGNPVTALTAQDSDLFSSNTTGMTGQLSSNNRIKRDSAALDQEQEESAAVEASVSLEFAALGRPRLQTDNSSSNIHNNNNNNHSNKDGRAISSPSDLVDPATAGFDPLASILAPNPPLPSPLVRFPDGDSLQAVAPSSGEVATILEVGFEYKWLHPVVHEGSFRAQVVAFDDLGDNRFSLVSPSWLAAYFAWLCVSIKLLDVDRRNRLHWSEEQAASIASCYFDCAVASLYRHNFLQHGNLDSLQAISLLVLGGRDAGSAALIANLLASGLSVAQDLNLHRMCSDEVFTQQIKNKPVEVQSAASIEREISKRCLWSLAYSDWFSTAYRGSWILSRSRITTPLPLNCVDEDLAAGKMTNRPISEYTGVSWLLQYIALAAAMQVAFEKAQTDYDSFLKIDNQLEALLSDLPPWLKPTERVEGVPAGHIELMRSTWNITSQHKVLSIHRPFLSKRDKVAHDFSRRRVVLAAREILREGARLQRLPITVRIWTVLYHLSVALFSITLELFEEVKHRTAESEAMRAEVHGALPILEQLRISSSIADRGLTLVMPLLEEEKRLKEEAEKRRPSKRTKTSTATGSASSSATPVTGTSSPHMSGSPQQGNSAYALPDLTLTSEHQSSGVMSASPANSEVLSDRGTTATTGAAFAPTSDGAGLLMTTLPPFFADFGDESWLDATLSGGSLVSGAPSLAASAPVPLPMTSHIGMMQHHAHAPGLPPPLPHHHHHAAPPPPPPPFSMYPPYMYGYPSTSVAHGTHMPTWDSRWSGNGGTETQH